MIAFIVEGQMEKKIVEKLCPGAPVRLLGVNGDHVSLPVIAKFAAAQLAFLVRRYDPIHIIFDREGRAQTSDDIRYELKNLLNDLGFDVMSLKISVADRTTENWFLPFLSPNGSLSPSLCINHNSEGLDGKSQVKKMFRQLGKPYVETIDGVRLFCSLNPQFVKNFSPSFKYLSEQIGFQCYWNNR